MRLLLVLSATILIFNVTASSAGKALIADKILIVLIDEAGIVTDGLDTISSDELAKYIRDRLFKNFMGTGKMYSSIRIKKANENIPVLVYDVLVKEIILGQKDALNDISLHKYKKLFDSLDAKRQDKLKKQYPVLFQAEF